MRYWIFQNKANLAGFARKSETKTPFSVLSVASVAKMQFVKQSQFVKGQNSEYRSQKTGDCILVTSCLCGKGNLKKQSQFVKGQNSEYRIQETGDYVLVT